MKKIRSLEDALNQCRDLGMRMSRQRRFILELLWQVQEHMSAREIYDRLNQAGRAIGHTSVYQNLEALSSQGVIECIDRSDGRLYGNISDSHSHINCINTGQLLDIYVRLPEELIHQIEKQTGVRITDYRIDFYGYRLSASESSPLPASSQDDRSAGSSQMRRSQLSNVEVNQESLNPDSRIKPMEATTVWSEDDNLKSLYED